MHRDILPALQPSYQAAQWDPYNSVFSSLLIGFCFCLISILMLHVFPFELLISIKCKLNYDFIFKVCNPRTWFRNLTFEKANRKYWIDPFELTPFPLGFSEWGITKLQCALFACECHIFWFNLKAPRPNVNGICCQKQIVNVLNFICILDFKMEILS